jgi:hypothetical protein
VVQDPDRKPAARLHVAALLEREGHPLKDEVAVKSGGGGRAKIVGIAAGTMLVAGAVAASALGLSGSAESHAGAGQPVPGAAGHGAAGGVTEYPSEQVNNKLPTLDQDAAPQTTSPQAAPAAAAPQTQARPAPAAHQTPAHSTKHVSSPSSSSTSTHPTSAQPAPSQPAPSQPAPAHQGPLTTTLQNVVTPVTQTVDDTLQPALSMIPIVGGLLGG